MPAPVWTPEKELAFLTVLAETANVSKACAAVDVARQTAYDRRELEPVFAERWQKALAVGVEALEDEANRRAFHGVDKPVFYQGVLAGQWYDAEGKPAKEMDVAESFRPHFIREYSDTLAIFLLKAHKPEKYRERAEVEHKGEVFSLHIHGEEKRG